MTTQEMQNKYVDNMVKLAKKPDDVKEKVASGEVNYTDVLKKENGCNFKMYGEVEKKCSKCGYVIPFTDDDAQALEDTIKSTTETPKCMGSALGYVVFVIKT